MKRRLITEKINERNLLLVVDMLRKADKPALNPTIGSSNGNSSKFVML